jgi:3-isopropylmalate dehydrogenase
VPARSGSDGQVIDTSSSGENTEGSSPRSERIEGREELAVDTLVITRRAPSASCGGPSRRAAPGPGSAADGVRRVTCVDKANVFRSYAFFRQVFQETARDFPDVRTDFAYVDAMTIRDPGRRTTT